MPPPNFNISTQNVGGMRGEYQKKHGPKFGILRQFIPKDTDFCVLTEVRCDISTVRNSKIKWGLVPSLYSVHQQARGGVIVYSHPKYKLIEHSARYSTTPGHAAMGVYNTPTGSKIIVAGIYGPSINSDVESLAYYQEVHEILNELSNTFQTASIVMAGDFNAILSENDTSSFHINKRRTSEYLQEIIQNLHLVDLASRAKKMQHTWFRRNDNTQSSRLDMILTNLPITELNYKTTITIFDHALVQASFGQKRQKTQPTMKDYILGSDEFLLGYYDLLSECLTSCTPKENLNNITRDSNTPDSDTETQSNSQSTGTETDEEDIEDQEQGQEQHDRTNNIEDEQNRAPMDDGLTAHNPQTGRTDLHFIQDIIDRMTQLHNVIDKNQSRRKHEKLIQASRRMYQLHKNINKEKPAEARLQEQEEYNEIQRELRMEAELKEKAKQVRIQNFYKAKTGKLNATTFYSVKDKQGSRDINKLQHDG